MPSERISLQPLKVELKLVILVQRATKEVWNTATSHNMDPNTVRKRTEAMRHHFNTAVCQELGVSDRYQRVSVLLLRWDERLDKDLRCAKEVSTTNFHRYRMQLTSYSLSDGRFGESVSRNIWVRNSDCHTGMSPEQAGGTAESPCCIIRPPERWTSPRHSTHCLL